MPPSATELMLLHVVAPLVIGLAIAACAHAWLRRGVAGDDPDAPRRQARFERNRFLVGAAFWLPSLVLVFRDAGRWRDDAELPLLVALVLVTALVGALRAHRRMRALARPPR